MNSSEKIVRFFECLIPITICNIKCNYCYVIQRNYRNMKKANMLYNPEQIGEALNKNRLGGACYFSICGAGETLAQPEIVEIIKNILKQGHYINITTNGTLTSVFKKFKEIDKECLKRLHFSFSFHYLELKRLNLLDKFFENIELVRNIGCSFMTQINLYDDYLEYLDEIKDICMNKLGALPQVAATRKEKSGLVDIELYTDLNREEYERIGNTFDSNLFKYTMKNFNKKRNEFCFAGDRSGVLNLATGELRKCYGDPTFQNIFKDPTKKIKFEPVGNNCYSSFCLNSSHFMALGVIDNDDTETYCSLRDREEANWFNKTMREALSQKIKGNNIVLSEFNKNKVNKKEKAKRLYSNTKKVIKKIIKVDKRCQEPKN